MNVSSILRRKGTHVETAESHTTVGEAAQRLTTDEGTSLVLRLYQRHALKASGICGG